MMIRAHNGGDLFRGDTSMSCKPDHKTYALTYLFEDTGDVPPVHSQPVVVLLELTGPEAEQVRLRAGEVLGQLGDDCCNRYIDLVEVEQPPGGMPEAFVFLEGMLEGDDDEGDAGAYDHDTVEDCVAAGDHLTECDDDGNCEFCGHREPPLLLALRCDEISQEEVDALYRRAADPDATTGILTRVPNRVPDRTPPRPPACE